MYATVCVATYAHACVHVCTCVCLYVCFNSSCTFDFNAGCFKEYGHVYRDKNGQPCSSVYFYECCKFPGYYIHWADGKVDCDNNKVVLAVSPWLHI